jgi:hypothetical protein
MANIHAIHSIGHSLVTYLRNSYPEPLRTDQPCDFQLVSSGEMAASEMPAGVTVFLYRVTVNEFLRNSGSQGPRIPAPLSLDLHYLLSVWSDSALMEQTVLAWAMYQLHSHPVLDVSALSPEGGWTTGDYVQLIPAELSTEDIMRIWDALHPSYRLSVSYIARAVRIGGDAEPAVPVVDVGFSWYAGAVSGEDA